MKEKILTNVRIIDPSQEMDEIGNIVIDEKGKIKSIPFLNAISDLDFIKCMSLDAFIFPYLIK